MHDVSRGISANKQMASAGRLGHKGSRGPRDDGESARDVACDAKAKATLLLVDDDRLILTTLSSGLATAGYHVRVAESVDEAEELLAGGWRPDLAILDMRMPGRDGLELARRLHSLDQIPFLLLTAYGDREFVEQANAAGALSYLVKPLGVPQLIPAVEAAIARAGEIYELRATRRQLQTALDGERQISVAIGIVMVQHRLGHRAAFEMLRRSARNQRKKLGQHAAEIVAAQEALNLSTQ